MSQGLLINNAIDYGRYKLSESEANKDHLAASLICQKKLFNLLMCDITYLWAIPSFL